MNQEERVARSRRAFSELQEVGEAFDKVREAIMLELSQTSVASPEKVLKLHAAMQNLAAVRKALQAVIDDGQMAQTAIAMAGLTRN